MGKTNNHKQNSRTLFVTDLTDPHQTNQKRIWLILIILLSLCLMACLILDSISIKFSPDEEITQSPTQDDAVSVNIGVSGGEFTHAGFHLIVPEGVLNEDIEFTIRQVQEPPSLPQDAGVEPFGMFYEITPSKSLELNQPIEIILPLDLSPDESDENYSIYRFDSEKWSDLGGIIVGDTIQTYIYQFSFITVVRTSAVYRPHRFICSNTNDFSRIFIYRYNPATEWFGSSASPILPPPASCTPTQEGVRILPTGIYAWCIDYYDENTGWECYIHYGAGHPDNSVIENDPKDTKIASTTFVYDVITDVPGRCDLNMMNCWGNTSADVIFPPGVGPWPTATSGAPSVRFSGPRGVFVIVQDGNLISGGWVESPFPAYSNSITDGNWDRSDQSQLGSSGEDMWLKVNYDTTGCESNFTYYFDVELFNLFLIRAIDTCGNVTYPNEEYLFLDAEEEIEEDEPEDQPPEYVWEEVGEGDCIGHDVGETEGFTPDDSKATPGYTAICWDNENYINTYSRGVYCIYKEIEWESCTGGPNIGKMYRPVEVDSN